ncbi:MAG: type I methionyl aminopeptidase [Clostridia bacterium]|nr:type I methionyl aminopeptidase [Clostridia bacterium]
MITIKNPEQIACMRRAGALLHQVLSALAREVRPGVTTASLDRLAQAMIRDHGAVPSFLGYEGFPASVCTSVDDCVIHGIPSDRQTLREGSLLSLDCGLILDGWQADSALTVPVGEVSSEARQLIAVTEAAFFAGARNAVNGRTLGDIGHAVQQTAESAGYGVIRDYTGHGIGRDMHEDPAVYNFGIPGHGQRISAGMTLAIEPMIALGDWHTDEGDDGWAVRTRDGRPSAHYEHTVAVAENGLPEILTLPGFQWKEHQHGTDTV